MKLLWIRHGATVSNELKKYIGKTEEPLSLKGAAVIRQYKKEGKYPPADFIAASPMKRCRQTAELIYGCRPSILMEGWREIDFGKFEGESYSTLKDDSEYQKWIDSGGMLPFPEGEGRESFQKRCVGGFRKFCMMLDKNAFQQEGIRKTAALIVHGGTIMAVLSAFSDGDYYDYQCGNGEGYCCELCLENGISLRQIEKL